MEKRRRFVLLDTLRGISIILMVIYHFYFDLQYYFNFPAIIIYNPLVEFLQVFFASVFIALSGISSCFSKNNLKRGIKLLALALVVSLVTYLFDRSVFVRFGILHFLGAASLIYALIGEHVQKFRIHPAIFIGLFIIFYFLLSPAYDIEHLWILGIHSSSFSSGDYFPIFPWIFIYFFGAYLGKYLLTHPMPNWFLNFHEPFFSKVGRHSLFIYLFHQPVLMGVYLPHSIFNSAFSKMML